MNLIPQNPIPHHPQNIQTFDIHPKETLYINNLNDKIKPDDILDIICKKKEKLRGQAFIIFKSTVSAAQALKTLQGYNFLGKNMFAKQKSELIAKYEGSYIPNKNKFKDKKKKKEDEKENEKGNEEKEKENEGEGEIKENKAQKKVKLDDRIKENEKISKEIQPVNQPSNVLFLQDLPAVVNEEMLIVLFKQFPGFKECRLISARNVAFVEYEQEYEATTALHDSFLKIDYAKS